MEKQGKKGKRKKVFTRAEMNVIDNAIFEEVKDKPAITMAPGELEKMVRKVHETAAKEVMKKHENKMKCPLCGTSSATYVFTWCRKCDFVFERVKAWLQHLSHRNGAGVYEEGGTMTRVQKIEAKNGAAGLTLTCLQIPLEKQGI